MAGYDEEKSRVTVAVGRDAVYYHENAVHVPWSDEIQPFGFSAVRDFCRAVISACEGKEQEKQPSKVSLGEKIVSSHEIHGLRLAIAPFAPDTSGAAAVLFPLDALTVIVDAGGCAGNICGFDEPRWDVKSFAKRSTVFSAGLRDMDAIMGRDDRLMEKLALAADEVDASFAALIGTPVPAVIGTDYRALVRLIEKRLQLPAVAVDTDGTKLYDEGASKTWEALMKTFATAGEPCDAVGVIGRKHAVHRQLASTHRYRVGYGIAHGVPCCRVLLSPTSHHVLSGWNDGIGQHAQHAHQHPRCQ
jgi:nitrogenase molybdenum-cofactor synthesis protein NifE